MASVGVPCDALAAMNDCGEAHSEKLISRREASPRSPPFEILENRPNGAWLRCVQPHIVADSLHSAHDPCHATILAFVRIVVHGIYFREKHIRARDVVVIVRHREAWTYAIRLAGEPVWIDGLHGVMLVDEPPSDGIAHALEAGASGAMMKTADDGMIVSAIRRIARGGRYISPDVKRQLQESPPVARLSQRQEEVLRAIAHGKSNKDIADELGIRPDSVEDIANSLYAKLGVSNRAEAVDIAHRKHLL